MKLFFYVWNYGYGMCFYVLHCVPKKWRQNSNHYNHVLSELNILLAALIIIFPT